MVFNLSTSFPTVYSTHILQLMNNSISENSPDDKDSFESIYNVTSIINGI